MGRSKKSRRCPRCASKDILLQDTLEDGVNVYICADCDYEFEVGGRGSKNYEDEFESDSDFDSEPSEEEWEQ